MKPDTYQICLIASGVLVTALFGVFFYREVYPEYKIYQEDYVALEEFRSTYTHQTPPDFKIGIKQIVIEQEDNGPPIIDRCTSCHVALQIPYFSPTKVAHDINGNILRDEKGAPILEKNEEYIWDKLERKITELRDPKVNEQLTLEGNINEVKARFNEAEKYEALQTAHVDEHLYDVKKVLIAHPLIGKETRPFEYHPVEEYGCTSCHNGNGRGIVTNKAHGPVFDGTYESEFRGPVPHFTETDSKNDPLFARVFNAKPSHDLLFQTQPIFVGNLIQAKCVQCHQTSPMQLEWADNSVSEIAEKWRHNFDILKTSYEKDLTTLSSLLFISKELSEQGYQNTINFLEKRQADYSLSAQTLDEEASQIRYLKEKGKNAPQAIHQELLAMMGSIKILNALQEAYNLEGQSAILPFIQNHQSEAEKKGSIFVKGEALKLNEDVLRHASDIENSFNSSLKYQSNITAMQTDIDNLTMDYARGQELYLSQACYACHRISGFARGGVGPELTKIGDSYPWYIKESMVWPQADLKTSTMPNMRLDHDELEDLMTFLLAQKGSSKAIAQKSYKTALQAWEGGKKLPWEKPIPPAKMFDLNYGMTIFATEGCASCHRLTGFESNTGFKIEKDKHTFDDLYAEKQWFRKLFPEVIRIGQFDEELPGSSLVHLIETHSNEIDKRIVSDVRNDSILEEIEKQHPKALESFYSNFKYAARAKDDYYRQLIQQADSDEKREMLKKELQVWKDRVHLVLMMYIQEYGLGRLIGPKPNWSGIYRSDEWLMEHFRNPSAHIPRSIMPALPFDDTKFYALTLMLDKLAIRNRDAVREIWENKGFNPQEAYERHCMQCHGINFSGNGPISQWIYPIPKNLRNPDFLRNLTKERAYHSIVHGVKGTPMPPWGENAQDKPEELKNELNSSPIITEKEAQYIVDWLFSTLPGAEVIEQSRDVPKWQYGPEEVIKELKKEGLRLKPKEQLNNGKKILSALHQQEVYYAALEPKLATSKSNEIEAVFDVIPTMGDDPDPNHYYIKKEYYTPQNIEAGKDFFLLNCAVCHGNEADGSGARSSAMLDAKPRMLTNLDWINTRDDLRLLRSIKFGVPGTSMTPWGDLTNPLQRLQLVVFIRSLTIEQENRIELDRLLYQNYTTALLTIDKARQAQSKIMEDFQKEKAELERRSSLLEYESTVKKKPSEEAIEVYKKNIEIDKKLNEIQQNEDRYIKLQQEIQTEKGLYRGLGIALITRGISPASVTTYFELLKLNQNRYKIENGRLTMKSAPTSEIKAKQQELINAIDSSIQKFELEKNVIEGKIAGAHKTGDRVHVEEELSSYNQLRAKLNLNVDEALRSMQRQEKLMQTITNGNDSNGN